MRMKSSKYSFCSSSSLHYLQYTPFPCFCSVFQPFCPMHIHYSLPTLGSTDRRPYYFHKHCTCLVFTIRHPSLSLPDPESTSFHIPIYFFLNFFDISPIQTTWSFALTFPYLLFSFVTVCQRNGFCEQLPKTFTELFDRVLYIYYPFLLFQ